MSARVTRVEVESTGHEIEVHVTVRQYGFLAEKVPIPAEFRQAVLDYFAEDPS